ncbi:MAG TPA: hypothetical protein VFC19_08665 [Candidatus Limnocylindrales bacterium]|nr:hypothetical protein [Candidatus Limnocylindrales bacterium]
MISQNHDGAFVAETIAAHERTLGLSGVARNPLLDDAYDRLWAPFNAKTPAMKT